MRKQAENHGVEVRSTGAAAERQAELAFAQALRSAFLSCGMPQGTAMLIDTSRNGWGGAHGRGADAVSPAAGLPGSGRGPRARG